MRYNLGVDLGGTNIKAGLANENGKIILSLREKTDKDSDIDSISKKIINLIETIIKKSGISGDEIGDIGIGSPGLIDTKNNIVLYSNNIKWQNVSLGEIIEKALKKRVHMINDAKAAALGEAVFGAGKSFHSSALLTIGTGIGGGYVVGKRLQEGLCGAESLFGHISIVSNGKLCSCGRKGCVEAYASATALIESVKTDKEYGSSSLAKTVELEHKNLDAKLIFDMAKAKDKFAVRKISEYVRYLSDGVVSIANILRPEIIIIGGGVSGAGDFLISPIRDICKEEIFGFSHAKVEIELAKLGNDAGIIGAAYLASTTD